MSTKASVLSVEHLFPDAGYQHKYERLDGLVRSIGAWAKVRLEFVTVDSPSITVFVDDELAVTSALEISALPSSLTLSIGFFHKSWKGDGGSAKVRFDDVVVDIEP